jgi:CPA1 family monovalent cation:H+ antiporter
MRGFRSTTPERHRRRVAGLVTRSLADIEYFLREPLGWREGTTVVWAGMRGAITVAAAQTLPADTPLRSTLVLIAFTVAALSLLVQGGTIGALVRRISPNVDRAAQDERATAERARLFDLLAASARSVPKRAVDTDDASETDHGEVDDDYAAPRGWSDADKQHRLAVIGAQRTALLDARDNGIFDADLLENALDNLDATQITLEMRGKPVG